MVLAKKQLSKVVAIVLVAMCAVAFMPMLNGEAFAAAKAKKPAKVTVQSVKQVSKTTKVKVTWKKAKNAKTYNIKIDKKVVKKSYKKLTFTSAALKAGKHKVYVQAVNGKKKGAWSKAKTVTVKPLPAKVEVEGLPIVGKTLTAKVYDKNGKELTSGVAFQWYRTGANTGGDNPIAGATSAEYTVVPADVPYPLYVTATAVGKTAKSKETSKVQVVQEITYFVALDAKAVGKGHTVPVVGDTVKVGVKYDGEERADNPYAIRGHDYTSIQWYADDVAITGATGDSFTLTPHEVDKVITAKMVLNHVDGTSEEFVTDPSEKVIASTLPTNAKITGMTVETTYKADGSIDKQGTPAVGDTLKIEFTKPAGAADDKATYQWTRGGAAISGATTATYTVKQADFDKVLTCVVKNADGADVVVESVNKVATNIGGAAVTVTPAAPAFETATTVAVKMGDVTLTADTDYAVKLYIDSVADENLIQTRRGYNTYRPATSLAANTQYYVNQKATALVGHKLIAVAEGAGTYVGSAQSAATAAMTATVTDVAIEADTAQTTSATTLTASVAIDNYAATLVGEPDVTYQWSKQATTGGEFVNIEGATKATFEPTDADQVANVIAYKVTITGTDTYKVTNAKDATYTCTWGDPAAPKAVTLDVTNENEDHSVARPAVGDTLKIKASVAKADKTMTYTWALMNGTTKVDEQTGAEYTIPADKAKQGYTVTVTAANTDASYQITQYTGAITVQGLISGVELVSNGTVLSNYLPTGDPKDDHVANPQVGDVLAANVTAENPANSTTGITKTATRYTFNHVSSTAVTGYNGYTWYRDGEEISGQHGSTYTIQVADLGKKISVKVEGARGTSYVGSEAISEASGPVVAYGQLVLNLAANEPPLHVGKEYTASVVDANGNPIAGIEATYTVTDKDSGETVANANGVFTLDPTYNLGHTIKITVEAVGLKGITDDALTWETDLEIQGAN